VKEELTHLMVPCESVITIALAAASSAALCKFSTSLSDSISAFLEKGIILFFNFDTSFVISTSHYIIEEKYLFLRYVLVSLDG
jgi:hypothetical protein